MTSEFSRQIFQKKVSNIKFHQNPSSGSRVVPRGQTNKTKLIVAFRNFANAPKNLETAQRLKFHCDLYSQTVRLKRAMSKRTVFCFSAAPGTLRVRFTFAGNTHLPQTLAVQQQIFSYSRQ
jgi:hypothetical protein